MSVDLGPSAEMQIWYTPNKYIYIYISIYTVCAPYLVFDNKINKLRYTTQQCVPAWPTFFSGVGMNDPHSFQTVLLHVSAVTAYFSGWATYSFWLVWPSFHLPNRFWRTDTIQPYSASTKTDHHESYSVNKNPHWINNATLWMGKQVQALCSTWAQKGKKAPSWITHISALSHISVVGWVFFPFPNPNLAKKAKAKKGPSWITHISALSHISVVGWVFFSFLG